MGPTIMYHARACLELRVVERNGASRATGTFKTTPPQLPRKGAFSD